MNPNQKLKLNQNPEEVAKSFSAPSAKRREQIVRHLQGTDPKKIPEVWQVFQSPGAPKDEKQLVDVLLGMAPPPKADPKPPPAKG